VLIIDSLVVPKIDMYNHFHLSKASGTLLIAHNLFPRMDFDFGHVYLPERNDRAFYADTVLRNGLDLMGRHRLLSDWGEPEALPSSVNTTADECNPFFLQDGVTLYFSSDRKGGLGGRDIYVTRLNPATNTYVQPDLLGLPFNSPGNEYFLVIDESINRGYFATDRRNDKGHVTIYTFVPNKEKIMVAGKSLAEVRSLAEIRSIKDTWKGKNVDSILKVSAPQPNLSLDKRNIVETLIYINDSMAYYSLDEFASPEARKIMENVLSNKQVLQEKVADLEDKRIRFNSNDRSTQEKLRVEILSLENDIRQLRSDLPMLEMTARNLEIKALTK
jgi:WD40-like Beta Propeller Repeat